LSVRPWRAAVAFTLRKSGPGISSVVFTRHSHPYLWASSRALDSAVCQPALSAAGRRRVSPASRLAWRTGALAKAATLQRFSDSVPPKHFFCNAGQNFPKEMSETNIYI
jgi:hypothetical protein